MYFHLYYAVGSGALDDRPPLLAIVNDESDWGIGRFSAVFIGVKADGEGVVPLAVVIGLRKSIK